MKFFIKCFQISLSFVIIISSFFLAGVNPVNATEELAKKSTLQKITEEKKLVLGTSADYPPYEFHAMIDGKDQISGFDIELAKAIADGLGVELEIKDMSFDGLIAALQTGSIDLIVSGMSATEERKASVSFTDVYFSEVTQVLVRNGEKEQFKTVDDLKDKVIGVQQGSIQESGMKELNIGTIRSVPNLLNLVQELKNGTIDALLVGEIIATSFMRHDENLFLTDLQPLKPQAGMAIAVQKGDDVFVHKLNEIIHELKKSGKISEMLIDAQLLAEKQTKSDEQTEAPGIVTIVKKYWKSIVSGTGITIIIACLGVLFGSILGLLISLMRIGKIKILQILAKTYIEILRGTPLLIQIFIIFYGLPSIGIKLPPFIAGVMAIALNSGAYVAEVIRSGIMAVDHGQMEASRSLGVSYGKTMSKIIIPQAIKNILPALGNEFITIIKESSIISIIGVGDLMYTANTIKGNTYQPFIAYGIAAAVYFILTFSLSRILSYIEGKLQKNDVRN